jgi:hypothetical protein
VTESHSNNPVKSLGSSPQAASLSLDLCFENHFSLFLIRPVSQAGQDWLDENVSAPETLTFGGAVACEPRYVESIFLGATADGLVCR